VLKLKKKSGAKRLSFTTGQFNPCSTSPCEQFLSHDYRLLPLAGCRIVLWNNKRTEILISAILQTKLCHQILHKLGKQIQYFCKSIRRKAGTNVWHSVTTFLGLLSHSILSAPLACLCRVFIVKLHGEVNVANTISQSLNLELGFQIRFPEITECQSNRMSDLICVS